MGNIKKIIKNEVVSANPPFNTRLTVELCENVHLHYGNLRIEMSPEDFVLLMCDLRELNLAEIGSFEYHKDNFRTVLNKKLTPNREFNDRLQVEEQMNGQYHIHYRNLRLELEEEDYDKLK